MGFYPNVQPICTKPQHGGLESGLPPNLRLCVNPLHRSDPQNWTADHRRGDDYFRPVWHRIADWPEVSR